MTSAAFLRWFKYHFAPILGPGRIEQVFRGLQASGILPVYKERFTTRHAAWVIVSVICFERTHDMEAVKDQAFKSTMKVLAGGHLINFMADMLKDPCNLQTIDKIAVDTGSGPDGSAFVFFLDGSERVFGKPREGLAHRTILPRRFLTKIQAQFQNSVIAQTTEEKEGTRP